MVQVQLKHMHAAVVCAAVVLALVLAYAAQDAAQDAARDAYVQLTPPAWFPPPTLPPVITLPIFTRRNDEGKTIEFISQDGVRPLKNLRANFVKKGGFVNYFVGDSNSMSW